MIWPRDNKIPFLLTFVKFLKVSMKCDQDNETSLSFAHCQCNCLLPLLDTLARNIWMWHLKVRRYILNRWRSYRILCPTLDTSHALSLPIFSNRMISNEPCTDMHMVFATLYNKGGIVIWIIDVCHVITSLIQNSQLASFLVMYKDKNKKSLHTYWLQQGCNGNGGNHACFSL